MKPKQGAKRKREGCAYIFHMYIRGIWNKEISIVELFISFPSFLENYWELLKNYRR